MHRISKEFAFSAGHILAGLPEGHKCARPHGHNYLVRVELGAPELDATGFVLDYGDLAPFSRWIGEQWDHRWLGYGPVTALGRTWEPVVDFNPTAELIASHMGGWLQRWIGTVLNGSPARALLPVRVGVSETAKTWAWAA